METCISRLDYKNPTSSRGFKSLPSLQNPEQITDLNEVSGASFTFDSINEAELFVSNFPKSYRPRIGTLHGVSDGKGGFVSKPFASIDFNTFWKNKTTGEINETAILKREKFIKKLKEIMK